MRIAVCHNQPTGGARRALHGFCRHLMARHHIDVFTLDTADDDWLHDADIAGSVYRGSLRRRRPIRLGLYLNDLIALQERRDLDAAYRAMARDVDEGGYDVALVDVCRFSLVPPVLGYLATPSVFYAHNGPAWMEAGRWDPPLTAWERARRTWHQPVSRLADSSLATRQRAAVRAATAVATNSSHTAQRVRDAYGVDAVVCPPGVEVPPVVGTGSAPFVLSVGEVEPRKGFSFLVEALALLPRLVRPPLRILANGANPTELARLEEAASRLGVALDVLVAPGAEVLAWHYANARLFVYAAHEEPLGLAPLEAMAHGAPVVAVGEGGVVETVVHGVTGFLTPRDSVEFASRVEMLIDDESLWTGMRRAARAHICDHWSTGTRTEAVEALLLVTAGAARVVGK